MLKYKKILNNYKRLYGEKKFNKISNHVSNSKHSKSLIHQSINKSIIPTGPDFVASIHSNLRYSFAKAETILTASLILFEMWIDSFGLTNSYPDKNTLKEVEDEIIEKTKSLTTKTELEILQID